MTNKQIKVTTTEEGTMVWGLTPDKAAVVADLEKTNSGWVIKFDGKTWTRFNTKASAVAQAKKLVKEYLAK
jgi:hypothetical protein